MSWAWALTEGEGIMIHLSKEGGTVGECDGAVYK